jgi:DNA-binding transcriptional regulator YiaG
MAHRRALLLPSEATTEASRRLREMLRRQSFAAIARRLHVDEGAVRSWAREESRPNLQSRATCEDVLGISPGAWDEAPSGG